jgi:hypothetical protein
MSQEQLSIIEPCISKKSIASDQYGVLYASPNGIVNIAPGSQDVVTRQLFTRDEWSTYLPSTMVGVIYQNMYIAFYQSGSVKAALVIVRGDTPPLITLNVAASCIFIQRSTANVYIINPLDNGLYQLDADPVNNLFYEWESKKFVMTEPTSFAALKVQADWPYINDTGAYNAAVAAIIAANQALWGNGTPDLLGSLNGNYVNQFAVNGNLLQNVTDIANNRGIQATLVADDVQIFSQGITSQEPVRLPAGTKNYVYEIKLTGNAPLRQFRMATSIGELKQS